VSSDNTTATSQSSQTNPYAPTIPLLANQASTIGGISTAVTPEQQAAQTKLLGEASGIPDLSSPETGAVTNSLTASTAPMQGMLGDAVNNYMTNTNGIANNTDLNPYDTPGFSDALNHMTDTLGQGVSSMYAGSGRDPSGAGSFGKSFANAVIPAESSAIQSQYNQNVSNLENANAGQFSTANAGSTGMANEELQALTAQLGGINAAGALPGLLTAPGTTAYQAANTAYGTPWTNLSPALAATEGIAGMGGTSSGSGTTTQQTSALSNILGALSSAAGIAGAVSKSDVSLKENVEPIGMLNGQKIHRYNFKKDPKNTPKIGVLAHEVQRTRPDAVYQDNDGTKSVDYGKLGLGMLSGAHG
jgi:hypothetical protein